MEKMTIKVAAKSNTAYYFQLLRLLAALSPQYSKFSPTELKVMALLLAKYQEKASLPTEEQDEIVFSQKHRKFIMETLGLSRANMDNLLSRLRKKEAIKDGSIVQKYKLSRKLFGDEILIKFG